MKDGGSYTVRNVFYRRIIQRDCAQWGLWRGSLIKRLLQ